MLSKNMQGNSHSVKILLFYNFILLILIKNRIYSAFFNES
jgi:hypothetical protein